MRYLMEIEYDGTFYSGWQVQPHEITIQGEVEDALKILFKKNIRITGSGRTDAGVHARKQFAHFDCEHIDDLIHIKKSLNGILPRDISIGKIRNVKKDFHTRYSAKFRTYKYFFTNEKPAILTGHLYYWPYSFNIDHFKDVFHLFLGKKDYSSFAKRMEEKNAVVNIVDLHIKRKYSMYIFKITGDHFLHGMVRSIMGTLLLYEREKIDKKDIIKIFKGKNRELAGPSVPPNGLVLWDVKY